jgi:hypothetical protein
MSRPCYPSSLDHSNDICRGVELMKLLIIQYLQPPMISSLLCQNILLSTLLSNTLSRFYSFRGHFSHPRKITGKIGFDFIHFREQGRKELPMRMVAGIPRIKEHYKFEIYVLMFNFEWNNLTKVIKVVV